MSIEFFVTVLREAKEDAVSGVTFSDSFTGGNSGSLSYRLASADLCASPGQLVF